MMIGKEFGREFDSRRDDGAEAKGMDTVDTVAARGYLWCSAQTRCLA